MLRSTASRARSCNSCWAFDRAKSTARLLLSAALEVRLALLARRGDPFGNVLGGRDALHPALLDERRPVGRIAVLRVHHLLDGLDRQRRRRAQLLGDAPDLGVKRLVRHDAGDEAVIISLCRGHVLAEQDDVERAVATEIMDEPHRAEPPARAHAEIDVARAELRRGGGDADVAGPGERRAAADAPALDGRDDGFREALDALDEMLAESAPGRRRIAAALGQGVEVGPGA